MSVPASLITAALVGAARSGLPPADGLPPALGGMRAALADRLPEEALLLLIGAAALHETAGRVPERAASVEWRLPAYRAEGDRPPCSPAAARFLERMLNEQETAFLPELLSLIATAGQRAPDRLLPYILDRGARIHRMRPQLLPVLGERGRWLGAVNPAWRYAAVDVRAAASLRAAWESDPPGRAALAITLRRDDPDAARRLIETTWRSEPEAMRREMLGVLEIGLSMSDEPFLERALDDRDAQVRRKAADLLGSLPGSRLVARLTSAAGAFLVLKDDALAPSFPGTITEAMMRDGVTRFEAPGRSTSPRTGADWSRMVIQIAGVIPLTHWEERFGLEPAAIIAAGQKGKWPRTLLTAFATAALRQNDLRWVDALLAADHYSERTGMLLAALSPDDCFARLGEQLDAGRDEAVVVFLRRWPQAWDEATGRRLIDFFARQCAVEKDTRLSPTLRFLSRQFAQRCPPSLVGEAEIALTGRSANAGWESNVKYLLSTLALRQAMREAVESDR